jgi:hypothetical protein
MAPLGAGLVGPGIRAVHGPAAVRTTPAFVAIRRLGTNVGQRRTSDRDELLGSHGHGTSWASEGPGISDVPAISPARGRGGTG